MYGGCPDDYEPEGATVIAMIVVVVVVAMVCMSITFGGVDVKWPWHKSDAKAGCVCKEGRVKDGE